MMHNIIMSNADNTIDIAAIHTADPDVVGCTSDDCHTCGAPYGASSPGCVECECNADGINYAAVEAADHAYNNHV